MAEQCEQCGGTGEVVAFGDFITLVTSASTKESYTLLTRRSLGSPPTEI